jgi:hypothetical protein
MNSQRSRPPKPCPQRSARICCCFGRTAPMRNPSRPAGCDFKQPLPSDTSGQVGDGLPRLICRTSPITIVASVCYASGKPAKAHPMPASNGLARIAGGNDVPTLLGHQRCLWFCC